MPNVYQYSLDRMDEILNEVEKSGISGILIFGVPKHKDEYAQRHITIMVLHNRQ